ncbi:protein of unknown function [Serratia sp. Tan611]|nr:protein of unknown function [Serratia sp. Tan611]
MSIACTMIRKNKIISAKLFVKTDSTERLITQTNTPPPSPKENPGARAGVLRQLMQRSR